jgi:DNA-binding NarL/FixJ family response regulator
VNHDPLRVAVVSANDVVRSGLSRLLDSESHGSLVVHEADRDISASEWDVVVYDLTGSGDGDGYELAYLRATRTPVVAVQPYARSDIGEDARIRGVAELLELDVSAGDLLAAVLRAARGTSDTLEGRRDCFRGELRRQFGLTDRELDMLEAVATGCGNEQIARSLFLSINSVKSYIRSAYAKIGVRSRSQAVLWAIEHGLAHPERATEPQESVAPLV